MQLRQSLRWGACLGIALGAAFTPASAEEGKWTPQQLLQFPPQWLQQQGLELPVSRLCDPARGTGLLAATISTGGCSAGNQASIWTSPSRLQPGTARPEPASAALLLCGAMVLVFGGRFRRRLD